MTDRGSTATSAMTTASSTSSVVATSIDGRRARRERGRATVIDEAFRLLQEGRIPVPVDELAERAGVSVSTIFRYFDGLDDVQQHALGRFRERFGPLFEIDTGGTRAERVAAFVEARTTLYEEAATILALGRLRAIEHPAVADGMDDVRALLAHQVTTQFAPELATLTPARRADLVALVDALTSPEAWDVVRLGHGRDRRQVRRAWIHAVDTLLTTEASR